jgi:transcriptional/translational regulatory protein YebC/TACO1
MPETKKVVAGAALGVAIPAAVGATKKLLGEGGKSASRGAKRGTRAAKRTSTAAKRKTTRRAKRTSRAAKRTTSGARSSTSTREQLYRLATRLKIEGRSQMTKAQLERAVKRARSKT